MADSDKKGFPGGSESTVRIDLNTMNLDADPEPALDMDSLLSEDIDLTFSDPDEPTIKTQQSADDLPSIEDLDALADEVFNETSSFADTFTSAPSPSEKKAAEKKSFEKDSEKTVILGPESLVDEGDPLMAEPEQHTETVPSMPAAPQPEKPAVSSSNLGNEETQRLILSDMQHAAKQEEVKPDPEHPSWQQTVLEHHEAEASAKPSTPKPQPQAKAEPKPAQPKPAPRQAAPKQAPHAHTATQQRMSATHTMSVPAANTGGKNRIPMIIALATAIIGLSAGGAGFWMSMEAENELAMLEQDYNELQERMVQLRKKAAGNTALEKRISELEAELVAARGGETVTDTASQADTLTPAGPATKPDARPVPAPITPKTSVKSRPVVTKAPAPEPKPAPATPKPAGDWVVYVSSHASSSTAKAELQKLQKAGINAEVRSAEVRGNTWHRVVVGGFTSKSDASSYLSKIKREQGIQGAWVGKE